MMKYLTLALAIPAALSAASSSYILTGTTDGSQSSAFFTDGASFEITATINESVAAVSDISKSGSEDADRFPISFTNISFDYNSGEYTGNMSDIGLAQFYNSDVFGPDNIDQLWTWDMDEGTILFPDLNGNSFDPFAGIIELNFILDELTRGSVTSSLDTRSFIDGSVEFSWLGGSGEQFSGNITSITAVPEPRSTSLLLSIVALTFVGAMRRANLNQSS